MLLRVEELEREAELARLEMELENLKALDAQRKMYETQLDSQREEARFERERTDSWIKGITELSKQEKQVSDRRLKSLEEELDLIKQGILVSIDEMVYQCHGDHYSVVDDIVDEYDENYDTRYGADSNVNESGHGDSTQHVELHLYIQILRVCTGQMTGFCLGRGTPSAQCCKPR